MSKRAEEIALKKYPVDICGYTVECRVGAKPQPQDWNEIRRTHFQEGYEQAEKDLALTWKDIFIICQTFVDVNYEFDYHSLQEKYEEILRRFKRAKEEKK